MAEIGNALPSLVDWLRPSLISSPTCICTYVCTTVGGQVPTYIGPYRFISRVPQAQVGAPAASIAAILLYCMYVLRICHSLLLAGFNVLRSQNLLFKPYIPTSYNILSPPPTRDSSYFLGVSHLPSPSSVLRACIGFNWLSIRILFAFVEVLFETVPYTCPSPLLNFLDTSSTHLFSE